MEKMPNGPHMMPAIPKGAGARGLGVGQLPGRESLPYEPLCAVFRRYLHGQQLKFTPERAMILDAVLRQTGLFEADQLVRDLEQLGHRVSRATAYRTLAHLQDAGILKQVFFDSKRSYYEVIAGRQAYDYLICVETGRVIEFNSERIRRLCEEICREHGFEAISHQLQIYAVCPDGKQSSSEGGRPELARGELVGPVEGVPDAAEPGSTPAVGNDGPAAP
jgi:Fur family ferric uptake transcriptional regulator